MPSKKSNPDTRKELPVQHDPAELGETSKWVGKNKGIKHFVSVVGSDKTFLNTIIDGETRKQSLPTGDLLILVIPKGESLGKHGIFVMEAK